MSGTWITCRGVFDGQRLLGPRALRILKGRIAEVSSSAQTGPQIDGIVTPGFLDLQVNGGGGVQLNSDPTPSGLSAVAGAHRRFGTVGILPTIITDAPEVLDAAAAAILSTRDRPEILGLHIEGPHISAARRGTHAAEFVRPFDDRTLNIVRDLRRANVPVLITLAPEAATPGQISDLARAGAVVSLGHTDAEANMVEAAIAAGARSATHLFNAMSPMTSRAPGAVGAILNSDIPFGIICDGHHVDDRMVRLALRAAGPGRAYLVSDAMATLGGPDVFDLYGQPVRLTKGRLVNVEGGLAGAHITQAQGMQRLVHSIGLTLETALTMAITTPAQLIDRTDLSRLAGRPLSDLLVLDPAAEVTGCLADLLPDLADDGD